MLYGKLGFDNNSNGGVAGGGGSDEEILSTYNAKIEGYTSGSAYKFISELGVVDLPTSTNCMNAFAGWSGLKKVDTINVINSTSTSLMFNNCTGLQTVGNINCPKSTTTNNMFYNCTSLNKVSNMDCSSVTEFYAMFEECTSLQEVTLQNTGKGQNFSNMFKNCKNITTISLLDFSSANNMEGMFDFVCSKLTNLGGFKNYGKAFTQKSSSYYQYTLNLAMSTNITHDSLMNVINNLYDLNLTYGSGTSYTQRLYIATNKSKLSDDEIQIALDKGWTID